MERGSDNPKQEEEEQKEAEKEEEEEEERRGEKKVTARRKKGFKKRDKKEREKKEKAKEPRSSHQCPTKGIPRSCSKLYSLGKTLSCWTSPPHRQAEPPPEEEGVTRPSGKMSACCSLGSKEKDMNGVPTSRFFLNEALPFCPSPPLGGEGQNGRAS